MGFSQAFCKIIYNCVSTPSFSILVEGTPTHLSKIKGAYGKETPPLSHTIWLNHGYPIQTLIENKVLQKQYDTYQVNGSTSITHLIYADDVLLLTKANTKSLRCIDEIFEVFSTSIGLEVKKGLCHILKGLWDQPRDSKCPRVHVLRNSHLWQKENLQIYH